MIRIEAYSKNLAVRTEKPDLEQVTNDKEHLYPDGGWMSGDLDNDDGMHLDGVGKADGLACQALDAQR